MIARRPLRLALALSLAVAVPLQALAQQPSTDPYYDFLLGQRLESEGDETGALAAMERAAAAAPTSAHIRAEIASLYLGLNQPAAAEKAALAALALDEGSTEAHQVLGMLMSASPDRMKEGITHLEKVMATPAGATDISLQFTLGRLYLVTGAVEKSVDLLTKIVEEQPYLMQARLTLVQALQSAGRGDEAIEYLAPVAGSDARLNTTLAGLLTRAGRAREAADALGRAALANPGNREAQLQYAGALMATGGKDDAQKALGVVGPLVEKNGRDTGALYLQAQGFRRVGDVFAAERAARAILVVDARSVSGTMALAQALGQSRRYKDVIDTVERFAAASGPNDNLAPLLSVLSTAYQALGQHTQAIDALTRAKVADPDDELMDLYLVQAYLSARRFSEAATLAETAQKASPDDLRFTTLQARAQFLGGSRPVALALLERTLAAKPDRLEMHLALAELYGQAGRVDEGLALLDKAETRFPGAGSVAFRRGGVRGQAARGGRAGLPRHHREAAGQRRCVELPRLHDGGPWPESGRGYHPHHAGSEERRREPVLPRQPRLGVVQERRLRAGGHVPVACLRRTAAQFGCTGPLRRRAGQAGPAQGSVPGLGQGAGRRRRRTGPCRGRAKGARLAQQEVASVRPGPRFSRRTARIRLRRGGLRACSPQRPDRHGNSATPVSRHP